MANKKITKSSPLPVNEKSTSTPENTFLSDNKVKIIIAITGLIGVVFGALITGILGSDVLMSQLLATNTPTITLTSTITPTPTIPAPYLELTAIAMETQKAERRNTAVAQFTHEAGATATQQFLIVLQTVQANLEATRVYEQAQQQVATEQAQKAEITAQAVISIQQTATASAYEQGKNQVAIFASNVPNLSPTFLDTFDKNRNGWQLNKSKDYNIAISDGVLKVNVSDDSYLPLIWTCDVCGQFNNFSYQVDIKTPKGMPRIVSGIIFGSENKISQSSEYYALSIYSSGDIVLERFSPSGRDIVKVWEHRQDLFTDDGEFHTLQIVGINKYAAVYIDGKPVGDVFSLNYSMQGYIGLLVQSKNVDVVYDNLKVVLLQ